MTINKLTGNIQPLDEVDKINEIIDGKQDTLVSGTNIKTINSNSILGSGNLQLDGLPDQTGKAGKFLQTDGTDASWESAPFRNIGEIVSSTIPLTDAGLHLLDGALIQGSGIYSAFVDYIADLYDSGDYTAIFETEANWQTAVTTYGVCGKFVYDSTNNTVRLPKITGIVEGTTDLTALGDLVEAGLPNITDNLQTHAINWNLNSIIINSSTGLFKDGSSFSSEYTSAQPVGHASGGKYIEFDASRSNAVYGNSTTVQPQTIKVLYYIVIATSTKTDIEVDIDEVVTDLNGKADVDLSNLSNGLANTICTTKPTTTSTASSTTPAVVVENYVNGTSWYRVYSDGWCEQGGTVSGEYVQVYFLKPYANTNYNIQVTISSTSEGGAAYAAVGQRGTVATTYFELWGAGGVGYKFWQTAGYIS